MSYPHPHPDPNVVEWADWLPYSPDEVPDHLIDLWDAAWAHDGAIDWIMDGEWPCCRELTTGCRCREAPGWYPGRPDAPDCPVHRQHRCNTAMLGRSYRSEGMGWRCPPCGTTWTLTRVDAPVEDHHTQYGFHPRTQCGPNFCSLLPPRPTMQWTRDAPEDR